MLFDAFIRSLEVISDVIEFGPVKAAQINTSVIPEAERATTRILDDLEKENYTSTMQHTDESEMYDENGDLKNPSPLGELLARKPSGIKYAGMGGTMRWIREQNPALLSSDASVYNAAIASLDKSVLDQEEEDMINNAVAEKGYY